MSRIGIVIRGDPATRDSITFTGTRLEPVVEALEACGLSVSEVVYDEAVSDLVRAEISDLDGVLVWVDPVVGAMDRSDLDAILRAAARDGVWVSAHPDTIVAMGTKDVLFDTKDLGWGSDVRLYRNATELAEGLPLSLATGPRVLKQYRGNGGIGVWKVEALSSTMVRIQGAHSRSESVEDVSLTAFLAQCRQYFDYEGGAGRLIDQPFQRRIVEGMIRCYCVSDEVVGFARQYPRGLSPAEIADNAEAPEPDRVLGLPAAKTMFPADAPQFEQLRESMEREWIPGLLTRTRLGVKDLPVLWDADFLLGPPVTDGDSYVLCEINVSSVSPFPPDAPPRLAAAVARAVAD